MVDQLIEQQFLEVKRAFVDPGQTIDHIDDEMEAVELVQDGHIEWRRDRALFHVTVDMEIVVVLATIRQPMDECGITVNAKITGRSTVNS